ncbi:MAG: four helix bundle protein [Nitrospirae bacterium]|nr:four helix bundle protein [Nitrospirota bacterium]
MEEESNQLSQRLLSFAVDVVRLVSKLSKTYVGREIGGQLLRSGTSAGANYQEACGAQSRADFIHELQIVFKELRETLSWLQLVQKADICIDDSTVLLITETQGLINTIARSLIIAKKNR